MDISRTLGAWRYGRGLHSGSPQRRHQSETFIATRTRAQSSTVRQCDAPNDRCPSMLALAGAGVDVSVLVRGAGTTAAGPRIPGPAPTNHSDFAALCARPAAPTARTSPAVPLLAPAQVLATTTLGNALASSRICCCRPKRPNAPRPPLPGPLSWRVVASPRWPTTSRVNQTADCPLRASSLVTEPAAPKPRGPGAAPAPARTCTEHAPRRSPAHP